MVLIVDEVQFCTIEQIEQLRKMANIITVLCYGLKSDYKLHLFPASQRLLEVSDEFQALEHLCECGAPATINALFNNNTIQIEGPTIQIVPTYKSICYRCYIKYREAATNKT